MPFLTQVPWFKWQQRVCYLGMLEFFIGECRSHSKCLRQQHNSFKSHFSWKPTYKQKHQKGALLFKEGKKVAMPDLTSSASFQMLRDRWLPWVLTPRSFCFGSNWAFQSRMDISLWREWFSHCCLPRPYQKSWWVVIQSAPPCLWNRDSPVGALSPGPGSELASAVCSIPQIISMLGGRMDFPLSVWL